MNIIVIGFAAGQVVWCEHGCSDGKCIDSSLDRLFCKSDNNNNNIYTKGKTIATYESFVDMCANSTTVEKGGCDKSNPGYVNISLYPCPAYCDKGVVEFISFSPDYLCSKICW